MAQKGTKIGMENGKEEALEKAGTDKTKEKIKGEAKRIEVSLEKQAPSNNLVINLSLL